MAAEAEGGQCPFFSKKLQILEWDFLKLNITEVPIATYVSSLDHLGSHSPWPVWVSEQQLSPLHMLKTSLMNERKTPTTFMRTVFTHHGGKSMQVSVHAQPCLLFHTIFYLLDANRFWGSLSLRAGHFWQFPHSHATPDTFIWFYVDTD